LVAAHSSAAVKAAELVLQEHRQDAQVHPLVAADEHLAAVEQPVGSLPTLCLR
jgi:hypothetical protein